MLWVSWIDSHFSKTDPFASFYFLIIWLNELRMDLSRRAENAEGCIQSVCSRVAACQMTRTVCTRASRIIIMIFFLNLIFYSSVTPLMDGILAANCPCPNGEGGPFGGICVPPGNTNILALISTRTWYLPIVRILRSADPDQPFVIATGQILIQKNK